MENSPRSILNMEQQQPQHQHYTNIGPQLPTLYQYNNPLQQYQFQQAPANHHSNQYVISQYNPSLLNQQVGEPQIVRGNLSRGSERSGGKSIFPQKLWRLVNNQHLSSAIRWSDDGHSFFVYENPLKNMCLGKENHVFYTKQPKSFVRQLHLYGFRKVNKNQFMHQFFIRGQPDQVKFIKRNYTKSGSTSSDKSSQSDSPKGRACVYKNIELKDSEAGLPNVEKKSDEQVIEAPVTVKTINSSNFEVDALNQFASLTKQDSPQQEHQLSSESGDKLTLPNPAPILTNNYDMICPSHMDWYENNYGGNYEYNVDSILNLYDNEIYPNNYVNDNIL